MDRCTSVLAAAAFLGLLSTSNVQGQTVWYVDDDAALGGNGTSWAAAYRHLQDALAVATGGDEIHVAGGTYTPDRDEAGHVTPGNRAEAFQLVAGVAVYGGYCGCPDGDCGGGVPYERDISGFQTVLSGDLNGDDSAGNTNGADSDCCESHGAPGCSDTQCEADVCAVLPYCCTIEWGRVCAGQAAALCCDLCSDRNDCDNSYHVVETGSSNPATVLDGVTITAGRAFGPGDVYPMGAGVYNEGGGPTLVNCMIIGNTASAGGGMANLAGGATLTNCVFVGNTVLDDGGAIFNDMCSVTLVNCTLAGNAGYSVGGIRNYAAVELALTNSIVWGNTAELASGEDAQIVNTASMTTVHHTCIEGWTGVLGGVGNIGDDPLFLRDPDPGPDETWNGTDDDYGDLHLEASSPCVGTGDNMAVTVSADIEGNPRIVGRFVDMGAYEFQGAAIPTVHEWGLIAMTLLVLAAGTLVFAGRGVLCESRSRNG